MRPIIQTILKRSRILLGFAHNAKKSGHTVKFCRSHKRKKLNEEKAPPQPKKTY